MTAPAWPDRLRAELDTSDAQARALAGDLGAEQLNWSPAPGAWSIGQCLEHLAATNGAYLPALRGALAGRDPSPVAEITPGWFSRWFIREFIEPDTQRRRAPAPAKIVPPSRVDPGVLERLLAGNAEVRELVVLASAYDVNRIRFRNPFLPLLRFTVGVGLVILTRHQRRHLLQAERVRSAPGFPS